ncbi:MAG: MATE family efflux transporter [candidate division Zixibacteria bacterium]|nr:MATE family efflux transporter [candidate division Zixibacteria bacterium]
MGDLKYRDHTEGSVIASITRMGLPSMIGFASANLYDIIDMFWVAKLGAENVAAITIFFSFYWVISSANMIAGSGSVALISRRYGEKNIHATEAAIKEAILLKWGLAIFFGIFGYIFLDKVLYILGARETVLVLAHDYGIVQFIGLGVSFSSFTIYTALRGVGDPVKAMVLMLSGVVLNIILDPFFIFGWWIFPELGVVGAAVASIISYAFSFTVGLIIFYGGFTSVRLHIKGKVPISLSQISQMIKIGFPSGINSISFSLSRVIIMPIVAVFGTNVVAAYGMGARISALGIMVIVGMGLGVSALIGQNLGAEKIERAKETAYKAILFSGSIMTAFAVVNIIGAPIIVRFFFDSEPLLSLGVTLIRIISIALPFIGISITMEMVYSGAGENKPAMFFSILQSWVILIPMILFATHVMHFNQDGVWWSMTISNIIAMALFYLYFQRGKWLLKKV